MIRRCLVVVLCAGLVGVLVLGCVFWCTVRSLKRERYLAASASPIILDRNQVPLYQFLNDRGEWCRVRSLADLGPRIVEATLSAEDNRFQTHRGVDPLSMLRAMGQFVKHRRVVSGASTITMQVIKLGENEHGGLWCKLRQIWNALRLERCATKDEILAAYLNRAPYGQNLVGVEAAAWRYYGKPARELTIAEAALLAGLPKAPSALMPLANSEKALRRRNHVLERMWRTGRISESVCQSASHEPLGVSWHPFPADAPHLAMRLRDQARQQGVLHATIDLTMQSEVERLVARSLRRYGAHITNAAVIVVDTRTAQVRAWVGSGSFMNTRGGGQVDACRAARSPGSALKPFTYALALERNRLFPTEMLLDDTLDYGSYSPENFDNGYNGLISATDALRHSLNVPAVMLLDRVGVSDLYARLNEIGFTTLTRTPETYGLGLTLGNCEVRLDQLVTAYLMLANLGAYHPLEFVTDDNATNVASGKPCFSRGTCAALYTMLEQPLVSEWNDNLVKARNPLPRVCWKTGTSTGYHDAWAILFNRHYTVGVWMGNNDGRSAPELIGIRVALPLATRIFRMLPPLSIPEWPNLQEDLRTVPICAISGLPASEWCVNTRSALLPKTQYLNRICDIHYPATNAALEGIPAKRSRERWPGSARSWDLANVARPVEDPVTTTLIRGESLRIQDPVEGAQYVLNGEENGDRIRLRASVEAQMPLFWYLDGVFLGKSTPEKPVVMRLETGNHHLTCMAASGRLDNVTFSVEAPYAPAPVQTTRQPQ